MPEVNESIFSAKLSEFLFYRNARSLLVIDQDLRVVESNPTAHGLFGLNPEEVTGKPITDLFVREKRLYLANLLKEIFSTEKFNEHREYFRIVEATGAKVNVSASFNLMEIGGEERIIISLKVIESLDDEKERAMANGELDRHFQERNRAFKSSQELYHIVSRNFPNGVISVFDKNFNYLFAEGKELYNMGITSEKLVGTNYLDRIPRALHNELTSRLEEVLSGKNQTFEISHKKSHYILNATGLADEGGNINKILLVEINNTQQKRAEEEVKKAFEKERQLNELKSRFVSMASHEFRTPLSTILSSINLMMKYLDLPDGREKILKHGNRIRESVKNLTSILNDFLSLDKLEEGKVEINPDTFDLTNMIWSLSEDLNEFLKEGQEFQLVLPSAQDVYQDPHIIRNILLNLLTNAVKYSEENQEIMVKVWQIGADIFIEVQDYGIGIPEEEQGQLFQRFFRAKNATNLQGTGLGLNIVQRYINLIHGKISFISKQQEGTTFKISFPKTYKNEENLSN